MPVSVGTTSIWEAFSCLILLFSPYRATADICETGATPPQEKRAGWNNTRFIY